MWFEYDQNNSGGSFNGPLKIWIEAGTPRKADTIAEKHGVYFDGCDMGRDCSCCGDRWTTAYGDGEEFVEYYRVRLLDDNNNLRDQIDIISDLAAEDLSPIVWGEKEDSHLIVFADGTTLEWVLTRQDLEVGKNLAVDTNIEARYGFSFYPTWNEPTEVFKAKPATYSKTTFYASDGNRSFQYNGWSNFFVQQNNTAFSYSSTSKADAKKMRKLLIRELKALREAVQDAALAHLADRDNDPDVAGYLMSLYEVKK